MVFDSYTQVLDGGVGFYVTNAAATEIVSSSHTTHTFLTPVHVVVEFVVLLVTHLTVSMVQLLEDMILLKQPLMVMSRVFVLNLISKIIIHFQEIFKLERTLLDRHQVLLVN